MCLWGFELPKTCSDGPVTYMHMMYWYDIGDLSIYSREELMDPKMRAVTFRDRYGAFLDETALHFGNRNINTDGARGVWYNEHRRPADCPDVDQLCGQQGPGVPVQLAGSSPSSRSCGTGICARRSS